MNRWAHSICVSGTSQSGHIRIICAPSCGNWAAVGFSHGVVSFVDLRTGRLIGVGRIADSDILAVIC